MEIQETQNSQNCLEELVLLSFNTYYKVTMCFQGGSVVKNLPAKQEILVQSLDQEDPLEKEMATHSSILAWKIPWTEEPGGLQLISQELDVTTTNNKVSGIQTAWYWHTGRQVDQRNKIENLETITVIHGQLVFCFFLFLVALCLCCCDSVFTGGYSLLWCPGFTMQYFPLWRTGSRHTGFTACNRLSS